MSMEEIEKTIPWWRIIRIRESTEGFLDLSLGMYSVPLTQSFLYEQNFEPHDLYLFPELVRGVEIPEYLIL